MSTRYIVPLLCAAAIAFACGPRQRSSEAVAAATAGTAPMHPKRQRVKHDGPPLASSLDVSVTAGVGLAFHVTNNSEKRMEINFPSGQTHDFAVLDSTGRTVWRWSEGRLFTQALRNQVLAVGETATFSGRWNPGDRRGTFTAVATLTSDNHPIEARVDFTVP